MKTQEYTTEVSDGVMTVRLANPNMLMRALLIAGMGCWSLSALITLILDVHALIVHTGLADAAESLSLGPVAVIIFPLLSMTGVLPWLPWRCVLDPKRDLVYYGVQKAKLSTITSAHVDRVAALGEKSPGFGRRLMLERVGDRAIPIRVTRSSGPEDDARLEEVVRAINEFLSAHHSQTSDYDRKVNVV